MSKYFFISLIALFLFSSLTFTQPKLSIAQNPKFRVYDHLLNPREHPDDNRRYVRPPDWNTFGNRTQFMSLRGFKMVDGNLVDYVEEMEKWARTFDLGDVFWPHYPFLYAKNLGDLLDAIKKRNYFLFDIGGYVPGSGPPGHWKQFKMPANVFELLESKLGENWLGMDNGEQDGRYVGGYASQMYPVSANRFEQYLNLQRHFQRLCDQLGNRMSTLVSLNFGHYFLKEGIYYLIGAETAQALPNGQVYYAFIRGAGKQYGVPWFGNSSVYNRWGYKVFGAKGSGRGTDNNYGPTKGASISLLKRLNYSQILYNSMCVGFESGFFDGEKLSPIGRIQQFSNKWIKQSGQPGTMLTPVAVMVDFFSGWSFPRHLYSSNVYRVWGNLPYEAGDYLTDGVLDMLYPGYQNSSYYHDESGFMSPTPYGDFADCLLSDAPLWLLERYPVLVIADGLSGGFEIRDKLQAYVEKGGRLFITAGSLAKLPDGLIGTKANGKRMFFKSSDAVEFGLNKIFEDIPFELNQLSIPSGAHIVSKCGDVPAVVEVSYGRGTATIFASPFGVGVESTTKEPVRSEIDKPLPKPYPLLKHIRTVLDQAFRGQMLFEIDNNLSFVTCRKAPGLYLIGIFNNSFRQQPLQIISHCGSIKSIKEFELDRTGKSDIGYLPEGFENADLGNSDEWNIAGADTRIFEVSVQEEGVEPIPHIAPPSRPQNRAVTLRNIKSLKEEILYRPTFFQHFDKVVIDWKYLHYREKDVLKQEVGWLNRQKLGMIFDLTSGINLYPDLRLVNNLEEDYLSSMSAIDDVMEKMEIIGSHDLILSLHRFIETNFTNAQYWSSIDSTMREICKKAEKRQITVHLRLYNGKPPSRKADYFTIGQSTFSLQEGIEFIDRIGAPNLRLAPGIALLLAAKTDIKELQNIPKNKIGLWMMSAPAFDVAGRMWNAHLPIANYDQINAIAGLLSIAPGVPIVLDGLYKNQDEEYLDARALNNMVSKIKER